MGEPSIALRTREPLGAGPARHRARAAAGIVTVERFQPIADARQQATDSLNQSPFGVRETPFLLLQPVLVFRELSQCYE
jgi:hypothetical protein